MTASISSPPVSLASGTSRATPFDSVANVWREFFPHLPTDIPRVAVAALLANDERLGFDDRCWLTLIAPSSSAKTVLLTALADATPGGFILDTLTPQTLCSGLKLGKGKAAKKFGLLHYLGSRPWIFIKDLSAILSKRSWDREEILGQLRTVYDGAFSRATGTFAQDDDARWKGSAVIIAGMTPVIDLFHALGNQLGERFIQLRFAIAQEDAVAVAGQALRNVRSRVKPRAKLNHAIQRAKREAESHLTPEVLGDEAQARLQNLVALVCLLRTGVLRSKNILLQPPTPEGPGRLVKQVGALACGLASLRGTATLMEEDFKLVQRVAFDSVPALRLQVFEALYDKDARIVDDFRKHVHVSDPTIRLQLDDLKVLGLAAKRPSPSAGIEHRFEPTELGLRYAGGVRAILKSVASPAPVEGDGHE